MQTNSTTKKVTEGEINRVFSYVKAAEDEKEDEKIKSLIKLYLKSEDEVYLYCPMSPITKTYIHFAIAKILSEFSNMNVKIVINILDISMRNHPIFLNNLNEKEKQKILEGEVIRELIILFGGNISNIYFIKQSEIIENMMDYKNLKIISSMYKLMFKLKISELLDKIDNSEILYGSIGGVVSDVLDYVVAKNLNKIIKSCKKPALIMFSGHPKHTIFKFIDNKAGNYIFSDYPLYLLYLPKLPKIKYGEKYLDVDFTKDKILSFVEAWVNNLVESSQETFKDKVAYVKNLFRYFFKLFLSHVYFVNNNNEIEKISVEKAINSIEETIENVVKDIEIRTKFVECIVMSFEDCFKKYKNKKIHEKEIIKIIYIDDENKLDPLKLFTDNRIKILKLCNGKLTQKEIAEEIGVTEGTVSTTLKFFKQIGIIKEGPEKKPQKICDKIILRDVRRKKVFNKIEIDLGG